MSIKRTQQISIDALECGMFVVQLDIPWIDSPFLKHTRLIKSDQDILKLRDAGVKVVVVDLEKGKAPVALDDESTAPSPSPELQPIKEKAGYDEPGNVPLDREINRAYQIRNQIKNTLTRLNADLEHNMAIKGSVIMPLVEETVASLERNNQALLNLVHLSRKSQKLVDHAFSTFCMSLNLGIALKLTHDQVQMLGIAALLHDSGWLQLPLHLMGKRTPYTATERKLVKSHVDIGLKMLSNSELAENVVRIIREHQECGDGSGYPKGIQAEDMLLASKILAVVDHYDECVHQLSDKPGMLPNNALRILYKEAEQGKYDPEVVATLIHILGIYPVSTAVRLNTGEKAVVEQVYEEAHMEPVVRVHYDASGRCVTEPFVINLHSEKSNSTGRKILEVLDPGNPQHDPERKLIPNFE